MNDQHLSSDQPEPEQPGPEQPGPEQQRPGQHVPPEPRALTPEQRLAWDSCRRDDSALAADLAEQECAPLAGLLGRSDRWRAAFQRSRQYDTMIQTAMHSAEVPAGLEARILAQLAAVSAAVALPATDGAADGGLAVLPVGPLQPDRVSLQPDRVSRRRFQSGALLVLAASLIGIGMFFWPNRPLDLTPETVQELARKAFLEEQTLAGSDPETLAGTAWKDAQPADPAFAFPGLLRRFEDLRWREVDGFLNRSGVAYDWTSRHGRRATLYVVPLAAGRGQGKILPVGHSRPPRRPLATQGQAIGVWTTDDCLFVLIVEGTERDYQGLLVPSGQAA